jgi:hypothetical protein
MQPDRNCSRNPRSGLDAAEQFASNAPATPLWSNLDGLNVSRDSASPFCPLNNGKPSHLLILLRNPGSGMGALNK